MLILTQSDGFFPDDSSAGLRYRLPDGVAPVADSNSIPQVMLGRGQGSGLLQLRLAPVWPEPKAGDRRVPFSKGRFRLLMHTPSSTEVGEWRATPISEDVIVDRSVSLNGAEAAIARRLGEGGGEVVEVEIELTVAGFAPTFPWLVQCDGELVRRTIAALMGAPPATWDKVEGAFLGLSKEMFQWHPLEPAALPPPMDGALRAIAHHARALVLESSDGGWRVKNTAPPNLTISLAVPYRDSRVFGIRWRFSEFLAAQPDPKRYLVDLSVPAPLEGAILILANDVPLAQGGIQRLEVEVKTGGPSGRVTHVFLPGQASAARIPFVRETFEDLNLEWRARLTVSTAQGPAVVESPGVKTGLAVDVTSETVGLTTLRFLATPDVFAHVTSIEITVGQRIVVLSAQKSEDWVVGRKPPVTCRIAATPAGGAKTLLGEYPVDGGFTVDAALLGVGEVSNFVFRPAADLPARAAYLAMQVEGGPWRSLDFGAELNWPVQRANRLVAPRVRYRTRHVPRLPGGATGPIAESEWKAAESTAVEVAI
jgi:hypothetical protein